MVASRWPKSLTLNPMHIDSIRDRHNLDAAHIRKIDRDWLLRTNSNIELLQGHGGVETRRGLQRYDGENDAADRVFTGRDRGDGGRVVDGEEGGVRHVAFCVAECLTLDGVWIDAV